MSLVKATILSLLGQLKVHASLANATITYGVSYTSAIILFYLFSFSQHWNFYISKAMKKVNMPLEFHGTSLSN